MPFTLITFIRKSWPFGQFCCKVIPLIQGMAVFATSITIAVIAADRWCRICSTQPTQCKVNSRSSAYASCAFSKSKLSIEVGLIWLVSFLVSFPQAYFQEEKILGIPDQFPLVMCLEKWPSRQSRGIYTMSILVVQLLIPTACLVASFLKIRWHLNKNLQRIVDRAASPSLASTTLANNLSVNQTFPSQSNNNTESHRIDLSPKLPQAPNTSPQQSLKIVRKKNTMFSKKDSNSSESGIITMDHLMETEEGTVVLEGLRCSNDLVEVLDDRQKKRIIREIERNRKVTNTLLYVTLAFFFSWLPWNVINIFVDFHPEVLDPDVVYGLLACAHIIARKESTMNALLYGFTNSNIKRELSRYWSDGESSDDS
jgi:hypothetical protein